MAFLAKRYKKLIEIYKYCLTPSPRAFYIGFVGFGNLGDEALFDAAKTLFPDLNFLVRRQEGKTLRNARKLRNLFRMSFADFGMLGGGTLINRPDNGYFEWLRECLFQQIPMIVFGTGVCQEEFWKNITGWKDSMEEWKKLLSMCKYVSVRGPLSARSLEETGIQNAKIIGDPALSLAIDYSSPPSNLKGIIGINVGRSEGKIWGSEEHVKKEMSEFIRQMSKKGWKIILFVVLESDYSFCKEIIDNSGIPNVEIFIETKNASRFIKKMNEVDLFIGMKLHSVVLAHCAGIPSIMLEYRPKCRDYMMLMEFEDFILRTDKFSSEDIVALCDSLISDREKYHQKVRQQVKKWTEVQKLEAEKILNLMNIDKKNPAKGSSSLSF